MILKIHQFLQKQCCSPRPMPYARHAMRPWSAPAPAASRRFSARRWQRAALAGQTEFAREERLR